MSPDMTPSFAKGGGAAKPTVDKIVFAKSDSTGNPSLYTVNPDGTGLTQLTSGPYHFQPDWSPNRKKIAFWGYAGNVPSPDRRIFVINANGTNKSEIGVGYAPKWSPDGTKILFARYDGSLPHLWVMSADGTNPTQLTFGAWHQSWGEWSSDGGMIVFNGAQPGQSYEIFTMFPDGSGITQITQCGLRLNNCFLGDASPLSLDRRFSYTKSPNPVYNSTPYAEIRTMMFDGSNDTLVLTDSSYTGAHVVVWSPDGSQFAFNSPMTYGNHADLHTVNVTGANLKAILKLTGGYLNGLDW